VTSELDLEIKRELVTQAMLLARPAPRNKTSRLKKQWEPRSSSELIPLSDTGVWMLPGRPLKTEAVRPDAPDRCPALVALDFASLAAPKVLEYARAHLSLYRWWSKSCGQGKNTLGQEKLMRQLERRGCIGGKEEDSLFPDRVTAQLWLSKKWRDMTDGNYGLNLPQFVELAGKVGRMLEGFDPEDVEAVSHFSGVLQYMGRGLCSE